MSAPVAEIPAVSRIDLSDPELDFITSLVAYERLLRSVVDLFGANPGPAAFKQCATLAAVVQRDRKKLGEDGYQRLRLRLAALLERSMRRDDAPR